MHKTALILLVVLIVTFSVCTEHFASLSNLLNIVSAISILGLLSLGLTFVIATGNIDLSVGSQLALSAVLTASYLNNVSSDLISPLVVVSLVGMLLGLLNGALINLTRAPSFIVTLGMMSVYRSACFIITDATPIYGLPDEFIDFYQGSFMGVPISVLIFIVISLIAYLFLAKSRIGRHLQIYGDSPVSARALGITEQRINLITFSLTGLTAGLAGYLFMVKTNSGDPASGVNYELLGVTAVILGGANLSGGPTSVFGTLVGVLVIGILQNGLNLYGVSTYYQILFVGLVLILSGSKSLRFLGVRK